MVGLQPSFPIVITGLLSSRLMSFTTVTVSSSSLAIEIGASISHTCGVSQRQTHRDGDQKRILLAMSAMIYMYWCNSCRAETIPNTVDFDWCMPSGSCHWKLSHKHGPKHQKNLKGPRRRTITCTFWRERARLGLRGHVHEAAKQIRRGPSSSAWPRFERVVLFLVR